MKQNLLFALAAGILASVTWAQSYTYDAAGRLIRVAYPDGKGMVYTYDDADNLLAATNISLPAAPSDLDARRTSTGNVELSWDAVSGATGYIVMRRGADGRWEEIASLGGGATSFIDTSAGQTDGQYRVAARNANGPSAFSAELTPSSPWGIGLRIAGGGAAALSTLGEDPVTHGGWANVDVESGSIPYGVAVFSLEQNGVIVSESSVPASPPTRSGLIFIDYRSGVTASAGQFEGEVNINTGFGIANPGQAAANLQFTLRGPSGQVVATGRGILRAGGHTATLISDLRNFAPDFNLPANFATAVQFGSLDVQSDRPVSLMALRLTINQRGELLFTSTPIADLTKPTDSGIVHFPHFADGGGFTTAILLLNTSAQPQTGILEFFASGGSPLVVGRVGGATGSFFPYSIPPGGVFVFESDGAAPATRGGWVRLTPSTGQNSPAGAGIFRVSGRGVAVSESGISTGLTTTKAIVYVDKTGGHDMGIAIANPGNSSAAITVRARRLDGQTPAGAGPVTFSLNPNGHRADLASDIVAGLPQGFTGVLEITSPSPFVALTLRLIINGRGDLLMTTFPVADQTRPAPSPLIFPHLADGGGFHTEFILLGPISPAAARVTFFDDDGARLAVGRLP